MAKRLRRVVALGAFAAVIAAVLPGGIRPAPAPDPGSPPGLEQLLAIPGVVGAGVGLNAAGRRVVRVYTVSSSVIGLPSELDGLPLETVVTGLIVAREATLRYPRPVPIGVSTGHPLITAGTIGARVTGGTNVFALSNNHVYANANAATIGDGALQPGPYDGGTDPADRIGTLYAFEPIKFDGSNNTIDAAIALSSKANLGNATLPNGYGTPSSSPVPASVGLNVQKYGRTTELTLGQVAEVNVTIDVCYEVFIFFCVKSARFVDQIAISPGSFSAGGDSGSLIVTQGGKNPVALLFAGSSTRTFGNRIDLVLNRFGVTIDGTPSATLTSIAVTPASATIQVGQTQQFTATGTYSDASTANVTSGVTWSSSNAAMATINSSGLATGVSAGTANITASQGAVTSVSATLTVTQPSGITLTAKGYKVKGLQKADLSWTGTTQPVDIRRSDNGGTELVIVHSYTGKTPYTDPINKKGAGTYDYRVCLADSTSTCSNTARVVF